MTTIFPTLLLTASVMLLAYGDSPVADSLAPALFAPSTASVTPEAGWWWNQAEGGRGFMIEKQGNSLFVAVNVYDASGRASWYTAGPGPVINSAFSAPLLRHAGGQTLNGGYRAPGAAHANGEIGVTFADPRHGTITWAGGRIDIERFEIVAGGVAATPRLGAPEAGWWWNPSEGGRGYSIEIQDGSLFVTGYMYDGDGNPVWYVSGPKPMSDPNTYEGSWSQLGFGQTLGGPYAPARVVDGDAGSIRLDFVSSRIAFLTLPTGKKILISRYVFACDGLAMLRHGVCGVPDIAAAGLPASADLPPKPLDAQARRAGLPDTLYEFRATTRADHVAGSGVILIRDVITRNNGGVRERAEQWLNDAWLVNPGLDQALGTESVSRTFPHVRYLSDGAWIRWEHYDLIWDFDIGYTYSLKIGERLITSSFLEAKEVGGDLLGQYRQLTFSGDRNGRAMLAADAKFSPASVLYRFITRIYDDWITLDTTQCIPLETLDALIASPQQQESFGYLLAADGVVQVAGAPSQGVFGRWRRGVVQGVDMIDITPANGSFRLFLAPYEGRVCAGAVIPKGDWPSPYSTANQPAADSVTAALLGG